MQVSPALEGFRTDPDFTPSELWNGSKPEPDAKPIAASPKTRTLTIGVDPGLTGAIAFIDSWDACAVHDLPVIRDKTLAWIDGAQLQSLIIEHRGGMKCVAMVERVSAMPKQGVSSSFLFGVGFGSILGVLQAMQIPIHLTTPQSWKKHFRLERDKKAALHKARLMFPTAELHLAKHDGRAEALLIARYAMAQSL